MMRAQTQDRRPKILLIGKSGQVGRDLHPLLAQFARVLAPERHDFDFRQPDSVRNCVRVIRPDMVVNAAAYTAVDKAESEPELARAVNAIGPGILAEEAHKMGALLVHYSTDYVFDGSKTTPYLETDPVNPLNVYGKTKLEGEEAIRNSGCDHLIFRTSWVYSRQGSNFLLTMLRLGRERQELRIVADQIGAPTSSGAVARATVKLLSARLPGAVPVNSGTYHMTASGYVSWFGFANAIFESYPSPSDLCVRRVLPIQASDYVTPARRPLNSRLDCSKISTDLGISMPPWQKDLAGVMSSLVPEMVHSDK
jgi:dTDP-4-dehydrorhamnose reductase